MYVVLKFKKKKKKKKTQRVAQRVSFGAIISRLDFNELASKTIER